MTCGHTGKFTCHLGKNHISFLQDLFWEPIFVKDPHEYVSVYWICAQSKTGRFPQPRSTPERPWCHIPLDFVISLPPLELRLVSQLVSILRAMAKQKSLTKSWRWHSGVVTSNPSTKHVPLLTETLAIFYQSIQNWWHNQSHLSNYIFRTTCTSAMFPTVCSLRLSSVVTIWPPATHLAHR